MVVAAAGRAAKEAHALSSVAQVGVQPKPGGQHKRQSRNGRAAAQVVARRQLTDPLFDRWHRLTLNRPQEGQKSGHGDFDEVSMRSRVESRSLVGPRRTDTAR
jgi:hypothetical protein